MKLNKFMSRKWITSIGAVLGVLASVFQSGAFTMEHAVALIGIVTGYNIAQGFVDNTQAKNGKSSNRKK